MAATSAVSFTMERAIPACGRAPAARASPPLTHAR